jgi:hypothetical protein
MPQDRKNKRPESEITKRREAGKADAVRATQDYLSVQETAAKKMHKLREERLAREADPKKE